MSESLFDAFNPVTASQWKQKIQMDLKGADYNDALVWQGLEGIQVRPFYHPEEFKDGFLTVPGQPDTWRIAQSFFVDDAHKVNHLILDACQRGTSAIFLIAEKPFDPKVVLNDFPFGDTPIYLQLDFLDSDFYLLLDNYLRSKKAGVFYRLDPIRHLAKTGNWFHSMEQDWEVLESLVSNQKEEWLLGVDLALYQNAGANSLQQVAYALAHAQEYLNHLHQKKLLTPNFKMVFTVAIGSNYFFELSKIRALRVVYAALASACGVDTNCHIVTFPSKRNKTLYDYNVNLLRTTTENMSAVLGGANTIATVSYDSLYHKSNEFGERIARNQLLILKAESYFDLVSNPADGSFYIEKLTQELSEKALELFKNIEKGGGFLKQLKEGIIQKK